MIGLTKDRSLAGDFMAQSETQQPTIELEDGACVAVIGGGPAGSFASYFLLDLAARMGMELQVDIYEPRDFTKPGPASCNHCGGIISESLVQILATDGINLPATVVQRGIDSYVLHMDVGSIRIDTPLQEKRIASIHRGAGPRGIEQIKWGSFDGYLQRLAVDKGARVVQQRVAGVSRVGDRPQVEIQNDMAHIYDLVVAAVGVNTNILKTFQGLEFGYEPPRTTKTYICELPLGAAAVQKYVGNSMHVFLLNLPRIEFAALIPKGDYVTVCLLGEDIDKELIQAFLNSPEVGQCLPPGWSAPATLCHCGPRINIEAAVRPFGDRIVLVGDCGATRLYKDGIGAAYRTAKAAANTAVFNGIGAEDFRRHYEPAYRAITADNAIGKIVFATTQRIQNRRLGRRAILRMVASEQRKEGRRRSMSTVLWDTFTGSAPYREIFMRTLHPAFAFQFLWHAAVACGARALSWRFLTTERRLKAGAPS